MIDYSKIHVLLADGKDRQVLPMAISVTAMLTIRLSLSQPNFVVRNIAISLSLIIVVGLFFSRCFGYYLGIRGLLAGNI